MVISETVLIASGHGYGLQMCSTPGSSSPNSHVPLDGSPTPSGSQQLDQSRAVGTIGAVSGSLRKCFDQSYVCTAKAQKSVKARCLLLLEPVLCNNIIAHCHNYCHEIA